MKPPIVGNRVRHFVEGSDISPMLEHAKLVVADNGPLAAVLDKWAFVWEKTGKQPAFVAGFMRDAHYALLLLEAERTGEPMPPVSEEAATQLYDMNEQQLGKVLQYSNHEMKNNPTLREMVNTYLQERIQHFGKEENGAQHQHSHNPLLPYNQMVHWSVPNVAYQHMLLGMQDELDKAGSARFL